MGPVRRKRRVRRFGWDEITRPPVSAARCTSVRWADVPVRTRPSWPRTRHTDALCISEVSAARRAAVSVLKYARAPITNPPHSCRMRRCPNRDISTIPPLIPPVNGAHDSPGLTARASAGRHQRHPQQAPVADRPMTPGRTTPGPTSKSMPTTDSTPTPTPTPTDIGSFEDFGDVDFDEVVPLSIMILQWCIDACAAWLVEPRSPAGRCPPRRS